MGKQIMYVEGMNGNGAWYPTHVTNGDGSERYKLYCYSVGKHNICGKRWDMWYRGSDGYIWHAVHMGYFNIVAHCRRTNKTTI